MLTIKSRALSHYDGPPDRDETPVTRIGREYTVEGRVRFRVRVYPRALAFVILGAQRRVLLAGSWAERRIVRGRDGMVG